MASLTENPKPLRGILLMLTAVTLFTVMTSLIKAADRIPPGQAVFFRAFVAIPVILLWFGARGQISDALRTRNWKGHATRGLVGSTAMGLGFAGLKFLPLPEVTALRFVTPILIVIFAALMLGERVRLIRLSAVGVGLAGVLIILSPRLTAEGSASELFGAGIVLGSATLAAFAQIFVKRMTGTEHVAAIVFYFSLTASTLGLLTLPFGWVWPMGWEWVFLLGAGTIGAAGQLCLTASYSHAEAGVLAPFTYISMLWAIAIGWVVFAEVPTVPMLAGSALIVSAGVAIVLRERQLGLKRAAEAKVRAKGMQ
ncbi:MAG: DMT family transporter [Rhodobacteraceae bacterium]|nr:DMT family transporter [Alphaproteobacteria bacterium]NNK65983.1 DMT family transporter [Paracoccaceae bacterium]